MEDKEGQVKRPTREEWPPAIFTIIGTVYEARIKVLVPKWVERDFMEEDKYIISVPYDNGFVGKAISILNSVEIALEIEPKSHSSFIDAVVYTDKSLSPMESVDVRLVEKKGLLRQTLVWHDKRVL